MKIHIKYVIDIDEDTYQSMKDVLDTQLDRHNAGKKYQNRIKEQLRKYGTNGFNIYLKHHLTLKERKKNRAKLTQINKHHGVGPGKDL